MKLWIRRSVVRVHPAVPIDHDTTGLLLRVPPLGMATAENRWTADLDERRLVGAAPRFTPALP